MERSDIFFVDDTDLDKSLMMRPANQNTCYASLVHQRSQYLSDQINEGDHEYFLYSANFKPLKNAKCDEKRIHRRV